MAIKVWQGNVFSYVEVDNEAAVANPRNGIDAMTYRVPWSRETQDFALSFFCFDRLIVAKRARHFRATDHKPGNSQNFTAGTLNEIG